jgi:hypothetical protein
MTWRECSSLRGASATKQSSRRVGKGAKRRAHRLSSCMDEMVGTSLALLCPPYKFSPSSLRGAAARKQSRLSHGGSLDCFRLRPLGFGGQVACARNDVERVARTHSRHAQTARRAHFRLRCRANHNDASAHPASDKEGRFAIVTDVGSGMRWTRRVVRRTTYRGRRNRVVLAPQGWRYVSRDDARQR